MLLVDNTLFLQYSSGTSIVSFPAGGYLAKFPLTDQTSQILRNKSIKHAGVAVLGIFTPPPPSPDSNSTSQPAIETNGGTIAIFGDSSCFDDANERTTCHWLLGHILQVTNFEADPLNEFPLHSILLQEEPFVDPAWNLMPPVRPEDVPFSKHSRVVGRNKPLVCPIQMYQSHSYKWEDERNLTRVEWVEREIVPRAHTSPRTAIDDDLNQSFGYLPMYLSFLFFFYIYCYCRYIILTKKRYFLGCIAVVFIIGLTLRAKYAHNREKAREKDREKEPPSSSSFGSPSRRPPV